MSRPRDTDYASLIETDVPIVVQHTRLDSRQAELALLSTPIRANSAGESAQPEQAGEYQQQPHARRDPAPVHVGP
jgi:hypothetical protein